MAKDTISVTVKQRSEGRSVAADTALPQLMFVVVKVPHTLYCPGPAGKVSLWEKYFFE
ncbi:hypothetical protein [Arthrobacter sp. DR-2P]|nr:hypothetical protein [Arthrobacter sp. DR-2P]